MNIAVAVGLGAAVTWLEALGMDHVWAHDQELAGYAMQRLGELKGVRVLGPPADRRGGVVAFIVEGVHPHDVATVLDRDGVCVRAGHHCAMPLHDHLAVPASARASFHCYSLAEDVDVLVEGLHKVQKLFG
jgi:cysteine desulfurase/selenocysteine lyase